MSQLKKYPFAYLSALAALLALGSFFMPTVYVNTAEGTPIYIHGFVLAFGGEVSKTIGSSLYTLSFSTNIFALVMLMCLLLSAVASLLSKESTINRIAAALLAIGAAVLVFLLPFQVGQTGLRMAYGSYLCVGFALLSVLFDVLAFFFKKKRKR